MLHIFGLTIMTYLKMLIGIKSHNTKQCPARLSPPPVKLSSFIGGKFSSKRELVIYDCCLSLCQKNPPLIDLNLSLSKVLFLLHQTAIFK